MSLDSARAAGLRGRIVFTLAVAAGVYPLITAILYVVAPLTPHWEIWQRTLVIVPIMVPAMVFGLVPAVHRGLGRRDPAGG